MNISCCAWALSDPEPRALKQLAEIDFAHLDVQTHTYATAQSQATIEALNLQVCCIGLSFNMRAPHWIAPRPMRVNGR